MTGLWWQHQCFSNHGLDQYELFYLSSPADSPNNICCRQRDTTPPSPSPHTSKMFYQCFLSSLNQHSPKSLFFVFFSSRPTWNEQLQAKQFPLCLNESPETFDMRGNLFVHEPNIRRPTTVADLAKARRVHHKLIDSSLSKLKCDHTLFQRFLQ